MDVVSRSKRSRMMAGIKGSNTQPEKCVRQSLHHMGFRFRLHVAGLPGKPDIVLPKYHAVILVHGCFWHGHGCHLFKWPATRRAFWRTKIQGNCERDAKQIRQLKQAGWRVAVLWECDLRAMKDECKTLMTDLAHWLIEKKRVAF